MDGPRIRAWLGHASLDTTNRTSSSGQRAAGLPAGREHVPPYERPTSLSHGTRSRREQSYPRSVHGLPSPRWRGGRLAVSSMSVQNGFAASLPRPSVQTIAGMALRQATWLAIVAALLFLPAGRWNWPEAWAVLVAYGAFLVLSGVWWLWKDPAQLRERDRVAANVKTWDKVIVRAYWPCRVLTVVIAGLDAGRFRWSSVPLPVEALGWLGQVVAVSAMLWAGATNTYLSRFARIQDDRGHTVVTSGPYGYVRHPMYAGVIVLFLCIPLVLGSWLALLPGAANAVLMVIRARQEDRMLRAELGGYEVYAHRVRYRLLPGVW